MPIFELDTNIPASAAKRDVKAELAKKIAEILGVQAENMCVAIRFGQDVSFAQHEGEAAKKPCGTARVTRRVFFAPCLAAELVLK